MLLCPPLFIFLSLYVIISTDEVLKNGIAGLQVTCIHSRVEFGKRREASRPFTAHFNDSILHLALGLLSKIVFCLLLLLLFVCLECEFLKQKVKRRKLFEGGFMYTLSNNPTFLDPSYRHNLMK